MFGRVGPGLPGCGDIALILQMAQGNSPLAADIILDCHTGATLVQEFRRVLGAGPSSARRFAGAAQRLHTRDTVELTRASQR